ncbi:MlaD family protein [Mycobacterium sp. pUA109]|uniref:MlaD family protein n=1 Tax=Mycobacterium sp. pUA109 TaxID=3238982 RepID=UPI00351BA587
MKPLAAAWRLSLSAAVAAVLLILVANAITQPVASDQRTYIAEFTDVSGLHTGADVRVRGVRVGKVDSLTLRRRSGQSVAEVAFTMDARYGIGSDSAVAVRYQALTGMRYVDVVDAVDGGPGVVSMTHIPTSMTRPSFDVTRLFNGLQPVLSTLNPEDLNTFTANVDSFLAGDGTGFRPVLESMRKLSQFLGDRQQVVATLFGNFKALAVAMSGHSKDFIQVLDWSNRVLDGTLTILDEIRKDAIYGPEFVSATLQLLDSVGFKDGSVDLDDALDTAFTNLDDFISAFKLAPAMWDNIPPIGEPGVPVECSKGRAELPLPVDVLLNGQRVVLCNQ